MPGLRYAVGRLGSGSDVLGLDDAMRREHDWGCRLTLLVDEAGRASIPHVSLLLEWELPKSYPRAVSPDAGRSSSLDAGTVARMS